MDKWTHYKTIHVGKDVNDICMSRDGTIYIAIGKASKGGIAKVNSDDSIDTHEIGHPYRQLAYNTTNDTIMGTSSDHVNTFTCSDLSSILSVLPRANAWGLCCSPDAKIYFTDPRAKTVYNLDGTTKTPLVTKKLSLKLKSTWSLVALNDRVFISDRKKRQILCHSLTGMFLWRCKLGRPFQKYYQVAQGELEIEYQGGLCLYQTDRVLVCDTVNQEIIMLDREGKILSKYTDELIDRPSHIAANDQFVAIINSATLFDCKIIIYNTGEKVSQL